MALHTIHSPLSFIHSYSTAARCGPLLRAAMSSDDVLPEGWTKKFSNSKKKDYYQNKKLSLSVWSVQDMWAANVSQLIGPCTRTASNSWVAAAA